MVCLASCRVVPLSRRVVPNLAPSGAGKTTALSMLTADLSPTFGHATVHGLDIFRNREEVYNIMGEWHAWLLHPWRA